MITKEETIEYLNKHGYKAYMDGFDIMVAVDHVLSQKEHKALEKVIQRSGYESSWGWKVVKGEL